ncbi:hypothetical protein A3Q56_08706 [Intoshia linei]|uniref:Uncharacterized protein n=1 Tax=Intoshia linei TaxID=1819745 RepID=A0A177ANG1_9BILA|nr:hypothetical protein A3Q56_08706 [Intoshia linei]
MEKSISKPKEIFDAEGNLIMDPTKWIEEFEDYLNLLSLISNSDVKFNDITTAKLMLNFLGPLARNCLKLCKSSESTAIIKMENLQYNP